MKTTLCAAAAVMLAMVVPLAQADEEANARVHHREVLMESAGAHMATLACSMKNECNLESKVLKRAAKGIALVGELSIPAFKDPTPGATVKTTASAKIWESWDKFEQGLQAMSEKANILAKAAAAEDRDAMGAALSELGKGCKGCHDTYREKHSH